MPDAETIRARAFWSGTISFGLVSIPVNLFSANRSGRVSLRMLDEDGTPLARRYYDPESGREVPRDRIVRGYEIEKDQFVVVTDEELSSLEPDKTRDIDLRRFVERDAIDPIYFERAYFLTPAGNSTKAYRLLAAVMERTGRAGMATFVMRTKEYLVAILAENGILRAETLRFADEIRGVEEIDLPDRPELDDARIREIEKSMGRITRKTLKESELEDEYSDRLRGIVERKRKKGEGVVQPASAAVEAEDGETEVIDLMEVLKRSLQEPEPGTRTARSGAGGKSRGDLGGLTKSELYERARELDIQGRSSMNKSELVRAIRKSA